MTETGQIVVGIFVLIVVYILTRKFNAWRIKRTYLTIMNELEAEGALDPSSAVDLPYARKNMFRIGMRDFRPDALKYLVASEIVGATDDGRYYLKNKRIADLNK